MANAAAGGLDVRLGGGAAAIWLHLRAGLIDEPHLAVSAVLHGAGKHLWNGIDAHALGYGRAKALAGERATHASIRRRA